MDSIHTSMCTVIAYPHFLSLIEIPLIDHGGGKSKNLQEDTAKCVEFIAFLKEHYPNKPVKYIFSSHWHLHSLSGISPFFRTGTTLITTAQNWKYSTDNGLLKMKNVAAFSKQVIFIRKDTTLLAKTNFPIKVWYIDSTYKNKPTNDYLFFYMPATHTLHASCMCTLYDTIFPVRNDVVYNDRLTDLNNAINNRKEAVDSLIKLSRIGTTDKDYRSPLYTNVQLKELIDKGIAPAAMYRRYSDLDLVTLQNKKDSILKQLVIKQLSPNVINSAVYQCIAQKKYSKALALAQLLNLYAPGTLMYIDTLGESCFLCGEFKMADHYDQLIAKINKDHEGMGLKVWKENQQKNK